MARRLKTIANWINEKMDGYKATIGTGTYNYSVGSYCGGNIVGYHGSKDGTLFKAYKKTDLTVDDLSKIKKDNYHAAKKFHADENGVVWELIKKHNSAETYRRNEEVEWWLARELTLKEAN